MSSISKEVFDMLYDTSRSIYSLPDSFVTAESKTAEIERRLIEFTAKMKHATANSEEMRSQVDKFCKKLEIEVLEVTTILKMHKAIKNFKDWATEFLESTDECILGENMLRILNE